MYRVLSLILRCLATSPNFDQSFLKIHLFGLQGFNILPCNYIFVLHTIFNYIETKVRFSEWIKVDAKFGRCGSD